VLKDQGFDVLDWDVFARTLETAFGHQDPEQNARDKLDVLKQTGLVEDFANKFQSLVAEIVTMPPSEGDLLQKFMNGLKPDMQIAAGIDPARFIQRSSPWGLASRLGGWVGGPRHRSQTPSGKEDILGSKPFDEPSH
jgi:hypothetical protein